MPHGTCIENCINSAHNLLHGVANHNNHHREDLKIYLYLHIMQSSVMPAAGKAIAGINRKASVG
jgi:hypothetical protein